MSSQTEKYRSAIPGAPARVATAATPEPVSVSVGL
jgi:hypothetical protein